MYREQDRRLSTTSQSIIVDRLLAELPNASGHPQLRPTTRPELVAPIPAAPVPERAAPAIPRSVPRWRPLTQVGRAHSSHEQFNGGSWARVTLGLLLGVGMIFWPYEMCGGGLAGYFGGASAVVGAAVWSAVVAWDRRAPGAHILSIGLLLWGLALAGDQLLQRTGYAYAQLGWGCGG